MKLALGQHISTADGADVGTIKHLILDPASGQVKTLVAEKGWLLPDDIEIPLDAVQDKGGDGLYVRYSAEEVKRLPRFDESLYTAVASPSTLPISSSPFGGLLWPNGYPYSPAFPMGAALPAPVVNGELAASTPTEVQERLRQQDDENAVISVGDDVFTADGEKVGEVENIVFDSVTGMPTHLTVRRGWLFHRDWELDADVIASVDDGQVTLKLNRGHLQARQEEQKYAAEGSPTAGPAARR